MEISSKTLLLIVVIVMFTVSFVISAVITYRIKRKNTKSKPPERKE